MKTKSFRKLILSCTAFCLAGVFPFAGIESGECDRLDRGEPGVQVGVKIHSGVISTSLEYSFPKEKGKEVIRFCETDFPYVELDVPFEHSKSGLVGQVRLFYANPRSIEGTIFDGVEENKIVYGYQNPHVAGGSLDVHRAFWSYTCSRGAKHNLGPMVRMEYERNQKSSQREDSMKFVDCGLHYMRASSGAQLELNVKGCAARDDVLDPVGKTCVYGVGVGVDAQVTLLRGSVSYFTQFSFRSLGRGLQSNPETDVSMCMSSGRLSLGCSLAY